MRVLVPAAALLCGALALTGCTVDRTVQQASSATAAAVDASQVEAVAAGPEQTAAPIAAPTPALTPAPTLRSTPEPSTDPSSAEATPTPEEAPTPGNSPTAVVSPEATPTPTPEATPTPEPDDGQLRPGDSGPEVLAMQQRLSDLGYWLGTPDGSFGSLTSQAVLAAQKAAGLSRDGVVGPQTLAALDSGARPAARASGDGVEIDLERQLLLVVRGGEVRTVLNTSTGVVGEFDTPPGDFVIQRSIDGLRVAPLGELWRPRYFNGGIAVHGSPSIPAYPASHGCARLSNAAIDMVWAEDLMPIGSSVRVY